MIQSMKIIAWHEAGCKSKGIDRKRTSRASFRALVLSKATPGFPKKQSL